MARLTACLTLLLVLLVLPLFATPSAEAKGIKWVKVCGPSDCTKTLERELDFEESPLIFPPWVMSGRCLRHAPRSSGVVEAAHFVEPA